MPKIMGKQIVLTEETKLRLDALKPHPRATYEEVVKSLLDENQNKAE